MCWLVSDRDNLNDNLFIFQLVHIDLHQFRSSSGPQTVSTNSWMLVVIALLAPLNKRRSAEREAAGWNPGRNNT